MNAQMSKHRVDPPPPMFLDGTEAPTARTRPNFRDEGANLILSNFRLNAPDQEFAVVMGETKVGLGHSSGRSMWPIVAE
jgi:hypothetical protein